MQTEKQRPSQRQTVFFQKLLAGTFSAEVAGSCSTLREAQQRGSMAAAAAAAAAVAGAATVIQTAQRRCNGIQKRFLVSIRGRRHHRPFQ